MSLKLCLALCLYSISKTCCTTLPVHTAMSSSQADPLPTQVPNTVTVQITGTSAQGQATSVAENIIVIIIAAVLGSILGLVLVGGAVALILFLILRRSRHPPSHKEVISAIQG